MVGLLRGIGVERRGARVFAVVGLFALLLSVAPLSAQPAAAQQGEMFFPETGFWVDAEFANFWRVQGGIMAFGYPVSRVFYQDGLHRQYFERAIFEHHEDLPAPYNVLAVRLGAKKTTDQRMSMSGAFAPVPNPGDGTRWYGESEHTLSGIFLDYWEANGGLQTFGFPISEPLTEPGTYDDVPRTVQYFERARMEHHLEHAGTQYEILLGHLGLEELGQRTVPDVALVPQTDSDADRASAPIGPQPLFDREPLTCGFNYAFWGDQPNDVTNRRYLEMLAETGCKWIRVQFTWMDLQPEQNAPLDARIGAYQRIVDLANELGIEVLVNISHAPEWAKPADPTIPADPQAFGEFMSWMATRFAGKVAAWQIWNEPNLIDENNARIQPEGYLAMARAAYPAIKNADPEALVVSPGLGPNSLMFDDLALDDAWYLEYLFGLNDGEILHYFDVFAVHAYGAGNSPDNYWPSNPDDNPGWTTAPEFYFRHIEELRRILEYSGVGHKPVWVTETGWTTPNSSDVHGYGEWITEELQAQYIGRSLEIMQTEWDWIDQVFIWHFNAAEYGGAESSIAGFSVTNPDGSPRPALVAINDWVDRYPQAE